MTESDDRSPKPMQSIFNLHQTADDLLSRIQVLGENIDPMLIPESKVPSDSNGNIKESPTQSPLSENITILARKISQCAKTVEDLIARVDI